MRLECSETVNKTETLAFFEALTSSYVLILVAKVNLNVLYKAVYLSRSIRPNKDPKIESQKSGKSRLSPSLSFTLFGSQIQTSNATLHCAYAVGFINICLVVQPQEILKGFSV